MTEADASTAGVVMYSSSLCPYCMMASRLLAQKPIRVDLRSVDADPKTRVEMAERSGRTSVPQIFIGEQHVGGFDELYALEREGKLDGMLQAALT